MKSTSLEGKIQTGNSGQNISNISLAQQIGKEDKANKVDEIVNQWKNSFLKKYCRSCHGNCCTLDLDKLTEEQTKLIFNISNLDNAPLNKYKNPLFKKKEDGSFHTDWGYDKGCPKFTNGKCKIYNHPLKPEICHKYPVFVHHDQKKVVIIKSMVCDATWFPHVSKMVLDIMDVDYKVKFSSEKEFITRESAMSVFERYKTAKTT